jgi:hypothetical protein
MDEDAYLVVVNDPTGASTNYYRCSLCNAEFNSHRPNPEEMAFIFSIHVAYSHPSNNPRIESVAEAAARVVAEAIRKLEEQTAPLQVNGFKPADEVEVPAKKTLPRWLEYLRTKFAHLLKHPS